ncbi:MAG: TetR/AcrR family transcriptional regulator [Fluviicola sp.]|nr:TetR/AcrR family transcriptional regulator [Fluviicola sp.]
MSLTKRQIEIVKAAAKLIGGKGIQSLTMKNLAAEMGFSEPALYRHFNGKTEILVSVLNFYKAILKEEMNEIVESELTGLDKLEKILKFQFNHFSQNPAVVMVIFAETSFQYDKVLSETVLKILTHKKMMIEQMVESGQKDGSIREDVEAKYLASVYMGSMRFTILRWRLNNYNFNLIADGNNLWETIKKLASKT